MSTIVSTECCFRTSGQPFEKAIWEVTFACPLKCPYCFQERTGHKDEFSKTELTEIRKRTLEFLKFLAPKHIVISGGEPLTLGEELLRIIDFIKKMGSFFSISTTGFPQKTFTKVIDYSPTAVNISIDPAGMSGEHYEYRKTKFETLLSTLETISERNIPIKGTSLVTKDNIRNVPAYVDMLAQLVARAPYMKTLYITNPYHIGYSRPDLSVSAEEVKVFQDSVMKLSNLGLELRLVNFSATAMPLHSCPAAQSILAIVPNGDIVGCPFLYQRTSSFAVGNVVDNSHTVLKENLNRFGGFIKQNMNRLLELTPECGDCPTKESCRGGCFAETFAMKETSIPALLCARTVVSARDRDNSLASVPLRVRSRLISGKPQTKFKSNTLESDIETKISEYIKDYMRETFSDIAHRFDHIECVVRLARHIAIKENANMRIVMPAAYFHDFAPRQHHAFHFHTDESGDAAASFLSEIGFDIDEITAIVHCIVASEFSSYILGIEPRTLEAEVVRDADFLESMGARGISRVFSFAGKHCNMLGELDYDPANPPFTQHNIMAPDTTPIQHFSAKLLLLKDLLITPTGRKIGTDRHKFMVDFLKQYKSEVNADS